MRSEQINELATALAKAQGQMKPASFDKVNPHFKSKFASLASCWESVREPLRGNGLSLTQAPVQRLSEMVLVSTLMHSSGQWVSCEMPLTGATPQQLGSALSYARRYSMSALLGIVSDDDDDGEATADRNKVTPIKPAAGFSPVREVLRSIHTPAHPAPVKIVTGNGGEYVVTFGPSKGLRIKNIPPDVLNGYVDNVRKKASEHGGEITGDAAVFMRNVALFNGVTDPNQLDAVSRGNGGKE